MIRLKRKINSPLYQIKLAAPASRKRGEIMKSTALNNILVAIDLSEATPDVIATAIMLNLAHSAKFWVVHADDSSPYLYSPENGDVPGPVTVDTQSNDADLVLSRIPEQLSRAEMAAEFVRLEGPAADSILEKAREIGRRPDRDRSPPTWALLPHVFRRYGRRADAPRSVSGARGTAQKREDSLIPFFRLHDKDFGMRYRSSAYYTIQPSLSDLAETFILKLMTIWIL